MQFFLTWNGPTGPNINYVVQYKLHGTSNPYVTLVTALHNNFFDTPDIPDNFYDFKVYHVCSNELVDIEFLNIGKSPCSNPIFLSYSVLSETATDQTIRINLSNYKPNIKVRVVRLNDNLQILNSTISTLGSFDLTLDKGPTETYTYKVEVTNVCPLGTSDTIDAGTYSAGYVPRGLDLIYENFPAYIVGYKNLNNSQTYVDPETIPPQKYDVTFETASCGSGGKIIIEILYNTQIVTTVELTSPVVSGGFRFPFVNLNLLNGPTPGTFVTGVRFKFSCE